MGETVLPRVKVCGVRTLADFGNRVPQFSFEVVHPVEGVGSMIRAVCLIPGASSPTKSCR